MGLRGPKKGARYKKTLDKELRLQVLRERVSKELEAMTDAQIANSKGLAYLVVRDKRNGKFIRVTEAMAKHRQQLKDEEEVIEVWEKDPSVQAFTELMNRTFGKPPERHEVTGKEAGPLEIVVRKPWS